MKRADSFEDVIVEARKKQAVEATALEQYMEDTIRPVIQGVADKLATRFKDLSGVRDFPNESSWAFYILDQEFPPVFAECPPNVDEKSFFKKVDKIKIGLIARACHIWCDKHPCWLATSDGYSVIIKQSPVAVYIKEALEKAPSNFHYRSDFQTLFIIPIYALVEEAFEDVLAKTGTENRTWYYRIDVSADGKSLAEIYVG